MKHEDDPQNSRRRDEDSHVANSAGGAGSSRDALEVSDQNSARLRPSRGTDQLPDEQVLTGTGRFAAVAFHGPIPPPSVIKDYNRISEGAGSQILRDAHEDAVQDREVSRRSFEFAIFEAKVRLVAAVMLPLLAFLFISLFLFFLEPPESLVGAGVAGIGGVAPLVHALLNRGKYE
ncbi:hypothetical protein QP921_02610 [Corynebacterium pseudodiphtheriticum]|uniref:hypothetical protein n=1 Tax=Corynebacterium pseudodiphtheriticum TaxID=37637 RepID=UPI00254B848C|nr:hypothetical protein [Corynebacterium pseudodiphtheriticum]MDK8499691.1 hypothetical protein [Corynebacterium pseudodiphtheriticum]MDK8583275.1 hypothetical protein [Corynebacterium pseudodiphtheriticum]MDK8760646.1 hypothetical protein [Corynebacterium pseudodiphtheriticum]MDK8838916.1 hypothetical protein [Corynebacterium pseudodiphtheriticum]